MSERNGSNKIILVTDDFLYGKDFLEELIEEHKKDKSKNIINSKGGENKNNR